MYRSTADYEYYNPKAVTTKGGSLVITITQEEDHGLNFSSGHIQGWNKFCFSGGYVEGLLLFYFMFQRIANAATCLHHVVNVSLPGSPMIPGFWPAIWMMGE